MPLDLLSSIICEEVVQSFSVQLLNVILHPVETGSPRVLETEVQSQGPGWPVLG